MFAFCKFGQFHDVLSPIYTMKIAATCDATSFATGEIPVASCCNGSSQKLSQVQLLRQHALRHGTRHALRHGKPRSQAGCWPIMYVFHKLRWTCDKIINRPSLSHFATTCCVSRVAAIFSLYKSGFRFAISNFTTCTYEY